MKGLAVIVAVDLYNISVVFGLKDELHLCKDRIKLGAEGGFVGLRCILKVNHGEFLYAFEGIQGSAVLRIQIIVHTCSNAKGADENASHGDHFKSFLAAILTGKS